MVQSFNDYRLSVLNEAAPFKTRNGPSAKSLPWMNESIDCFKCSWQKVEHLWKSRKFQVHLNHHYLRELLHCFNHMVKDGRATYFSNLIQNSRGSPKVLLDTIRKIVTPVSPAQIIHPTKNMKIFFPAFLIRANISEQTLILLLSLRHHALTVHQLKEICTDISECSRPVGSIKWKPLLTHLTFYQPHCSKRSFTQLGHVFVG